MDLKKTALYQEHEKLHAKLAPFGGWLMPIQYEGIIAEHNWTRQNASLFDICHMGEFKVYGDADKSGLDRIVTNPLKKMSDGECRYGFMLSEKGGIIDDVIVYKIKSDEWMIVVNAATIDKDAEHIKKHLAKGAKFEDISGETAKLDLQGPLSRDVLQDIIGGDIKLLKYYRFDKFNILGEQNIISRTGYTGEMGYEIYISMGKVAGLWNKILSDKRVKPAGLGARDTLRLEMCYPLYGQDITDNESPIEAGFEKIIHFDKDFIGKDALMKAKKSSSRKLICFATDSRRSPRHNYSIFSDNKEVGIVTSGSFSPSMACGIGMGYVEPQYSVYGKDIVIKSENVEIKAKITDKPFYKHGTAKRQ